MYRNLHGSGDMDAGVDDMCTTLRGDVYRITANNTLKKLPEVACNSWRYLHALARWHVIMYRNLHGSGDMDAEVDDICTTWRGNVYRIIVNSTQKNSKKWLE